MQIIIAIVIMLLSWLFLVYLCNHSNNVIIAPANHNSFMYWNECMCYPHQLWQSFSSEIGFQIKWELILHLWTCFIPVHLFNSQTVTLHINYPISVNKFDGTHCKTVQRSYPKGCWLILPSGHTRIHSQEKDVLTLFLTTLWHMV